MLAGGLLTACSSDEPGQLSQPATAAFSAQIGKTVSRAAGTEWDAGDAIGISGVSGTKTYTNIEFVTASGDGNFVTAGDNIYYQTTDPVTFTAYYPYTSDGGVISASTADQSQQPSFDFLWAQASGSSATPDVHFTFTHRMAQLNIAFTNGNDVDLTDLTFSIDGLVLDGTFDTATGEAKAAENSTTESLTATLTTDTKASLIVFPQAAGNLTVTANADGQTYVCDLSPGTLTSGARYNVNINVSKTAMTVTGCTISPWIDDSSSDSDVTMPVPPLGEKTVENAAVGDYYMSDGTFVDKAATLSYRQEIGCIGIVFYVGQHENDGSDYTDSGIRQPKCHGYVVALQDAIDRCMWGVAGTEIGCIPTDADGNKQDNYSNPDIDWNGYAWTQKIIAAAGGNDNLNATEQAGYPATYYSVVDYRSKVTAPANTSGWFLPAIGQMINISQNRDSLFADKNSVQEITEYGTYWTSSECSYYPTFALTMAHFGRAMDEYKSYNSGSVRPILAF